MNVEEMLKEVINQLVLSNHPASRAMFPFLIHCGFLDIAKAQTGIVKVLFR